METDGKDENMVRCPCCGGEGVIESIDECGTVKEEECLVCTGSGRVDVKELRRILGRGGRGLGAGWPARPRRLWLPRSRGGAVGGRFPRPFRVLLPLSVSPWASADHGPVLWEGSGWQGARLIPDVERESGETNSEELRPRFDGEERQVSPAWRGEPEIEIEPVVPEDAVTRGFSVADLELDVDVPRKIGVQPDETFVAVNLATEEVTGLYVNEALPMEADCSFGLEPLVPEIDYDPVDVDPLGLGLGVGPGLDGLGISGPGNAPDGRAPGW